MAFTVELIFAYMVLIPFVTFNLFFLFGIFFQGRVSKLLHKIIKPNEEMKDSHNINLRIIHIVIWIVVGLLYLFSLNNPLSISGLMVFLAFRSGAGLSRRFIFGIHDIRIMKNHLPDNKGADIASFIVKFGIFIEFLFVLTWGILYQYLSVSVNSLFGIEVNILTLFLWLAGLIYGVLLSVIQSIVSKQILLKNEMGIALMLSGQIIKDKVEEKKKM